MCGIAGIIRSSGKETSLEALGAMAATIRHRGPDGYGFYADPDAGLAHVRLSIIDLAGGAQPLTNEDGSLIITYNGEVYNYLELMAELQRAGHRFRTRCDTEVLVHAWEEWGPRMFERLNGQFAFALYDRRTHTTILARDRFGVRPLYYAQPDGDLVFASEVKAIFASGDVTARPDHVGLDEVFTFWSARAPRTLFADVSQLPPGCWAVWRNGQLDIARYWSPQYEQGSVEPEDALEQLDDILNSSVNLRMRADVPVGAYLSGGLDSTVTGALAAKMSPFALRSFSVTFTDPTLDESLHQRAVAHALATEHAVQSVGTEEIGAVFPAVIRHTETPVIRTAPAPMYLLAKLTRERGIKVVLTGEGSDEVLLGYDIFKEAMVRRFCLRQPESQWRPRMFDRLYPYLNGNRGGTFWAQFFMNAGSTDDPLFSHLPRFQLTSRIKDFYTDEVRTQLSGTDVLQQLRDDLPPEFGRWSALEQAAYLEVSTLLPGYLLSSQADRVGMAHSVEGRFPFLDHRLFAFASALPGRSRLRGMKEKNILHRWAREHLPAALPKRSKQPYRAPDVAAFFNSSVPPEYRDALLDVDALKSFGWFEPAAVQGLVRRCRAGKVTGFLENQALVGILSTHLWHHQFFGQLQEVTPLSPEGADVVLGSAVPVIHNGR
ncbi:MAG TPA: asparagine synthase (glutamine-hydrolyzing) [Longimicrobiales bacterium]|nr:asparagine synthase (glutamine-hydrolyzing) [Longimicrobiales bacterium]